MKRLVLLCLLLAGCAAAPSLEPAGSAEQARAMHAVEAITGQKFKQGFQVYHFSPGTIRGEGEADLADDSVIGFYDPATKQLFMSRDAVGESWHFGLRIHETTHALQDQLYDLAALDASGVTRDAYNAIQALIEGHAESVMADATGALAIELLYETSLLDAKGGDLAAAGTHPPQAIAASETDVMHAFEYGAGLRFVRVLKARGGYAAVDAAFRSPPRSTEQVLHPGKYPHELPDVVEPDLAALRDALPGWTIDEPDTIGELGVLATQLKVGDSANAARTAAGWGGDAFMVASRGEQVVAIWLTTWDTPRDADEFRLAMARTPENQCWINPLHPRITYTVLGKELPLGAVLPALLKSRVEFHN